MAVRTTAENIKEIIDVDEVNITDISIFITVANELVTECCTGDDQGYSTTRLELIERYLAAHLYTNRDPQSENERAGSVSVRYQGKTGLGFEASLYGQTAMRLDTSGGLAALNKRMKEGAVSPAFTWLGTESDD